MSYLNCSYILTINCFTSIFYFFLLLIFELLEIAQGYLGFCKLKISCLPQNTDMKLIQFYHLPQCYALLGYFVRKLFERCSVYRTKMGLPRPVGQLLFNSTFSTFTSYVNFNPRICILFWHSLGISFLVSSEPGRKQDPSTRHQSDGEL